MRSILPSYTPWKHLETIDFLCVQGHKREYLPEMSWTTAILVRATQFDAISLNREQFNCKMVVRDDCKNKKTWLTQTALSKPFSLFHTTYIEDIKEFVKVLFFVQNLFSVKRYSNEIVLKFLKHCTKNEVFHWRFLQ